MTGPDKEAWIWGEGDASGVGSLARPPCSSFADLFPLSGTPWSEKWRALLSAGAAGDADDDRAEFNVSGEQWCSYCQK